MQINTDLNNPLIQLGEKKQKLILNDQSSYIIYFILIFWKFSRSLFHEALISYADFPAIICFRNSSEPASLSKKRFFRKKFCCGFL